MALHTRTRGSLGALSVVALGLGGLVAAVPASADVPELESSLAWGFKQSFRNYVGGGMNTEPVGDRIVVQEPAEFDGVGGETRPYRFPVSGASITDSEDFAISTAGGVTYNFPAHHFTISFADVDVVVENGEARVLADLDIEVTEAFGDFEPGEYHEDDVHVADVAAIDVTVSDAEVRAVGTGLTLTSEGAAFLPYAAGDPLDDFSVSALTAPVVEISGSRFASDGASDVTVTGRGFYHANAIGARPPLMGRAGGAYIVVGYFAENWRPSAGAPTSARPAVSVADGGQKWAVPAESMPSPISPASGGITLEPDGSFSTVLTVDKSVIDSAATGITEGRYGIYTYPGSGATAPDFETFSPISFVDAPVVVTGPTAVSVEVGSTATFTVAAEGAVSLQWQSRTGQGEWADVVDATATTLEVATTSVSESGTQYRVLATNIAGTAESAAATLTVTKAAPTVTVAVKKKVRFAAKPRATVTVEAPEGVAVTGAVVVKAGAKVVGKGTVVDGTANVTLTKKLRPGARSLVAEFAGNADLASATSSGVKVKVKKAVAKLKAKLATKKVKAAKRAVLRVKVTGKNVKPGGKVKVTIALGTKKVRTLTVKVKGGTLVKVRLPRLAQGRYTVKAVYQGTKTVAKKSVKKATLRVR